MPSLGLDVVLFHFLAKNMRSVDFGRKHAKTPEKLKTAVCSSFCGSKLFLAALTRFPLVYRKKSTLANSELSFSEIVSF